MKKRKGILVTKASGEMTPFHERKLRASLMRSGADDNQINEVLSEISSQLHHGISTKKIYRMAFNLLKNSSKSFAARYHLKQAIMELGPSGYPFEKFVGEILSQQGYAVQIGQLVRGKCVTHEVDAIALTDHEHFMIECKYHNRRGTICDVKIPLYIQSRFKDVESEWLKIPGHEHRAHQGWVVTNTKFSGDAIQYGNCVGLKLLGWDYPAKGSLKDLIDEFGLYPITCLTTLTRAEKQQLLDRKIVLCREICSDSKLLSSLGMNEIKIKKVMNEGQDLCSNLNQHGKH
jgi:hypothetical protein